MKKSNSKIKLSTDIKAEIFILASSFAMAPRDIDPYEKALTDFTIRAIKDYLSSCQSKKKSRRS